MLLSDSIPANSTMHTDTQAISHGQHHEHLHYLLPLRPPTFPKGGWTDKRTHTHTQTQTSQLIE